LNAVGSIVDIDSRNQQLQRQIVTQYRVACEAGSRPYDKIRDAGFRCYSQFEEDGIILYVLSMVGFKTRTVVEMCCGTGDECMATNLVLNHGFDGYMVDGDPANISHAERFFRMRKDCLLFPPVLRSAWITPDNVNELLLEMGARGEVDVLSLDMDGNDYWVLDAITAVSPRLLVAETQNIIPGNLSLTIPYRPDFDSGWNKAPGEQDFRGASLAAMVKLGRSKGYRLIGAHRHGFNVFFLRSDLASDVFPEVSIDEVHDNHWTRVGQANRWPVVKDKGWIEV